MSLSGYRSEGNDWLAVKAYTLLAATALLLVLAINFTVRLVVRLHRYRARMIAAQDAASD